MNNLVDLWTRKVAVVVMIGLAVMTVAVSAFLKDSIANGVNPCLAVVMALLGYFMPPSERDKAGAMLQTEITVYNQMPKDITSAEKKSVNQQDAHAGASAPPFSKRARCQAHGF